MTILMEVDLHGWSGLVTFVSLFCAEMMFVKCMRWRLAGQSYVTC